MEIQCWCWWRGENNGNVIGVVVVAWKQWKCGGGGGGRKQLKCDVCGGSFDVKTIDHEMWCWWGENNKNLVLVVVVVLKQWKCGVGGENNENKVLVVVKEWKRWKCGVISWRGSRIDADRFPKRAPRAQASKGVPGEYTPWKLFWFNPLKSSFVGFWVIQTGYWQVPFSSGEALQLGKINKIFLY